MRPIIQDTTLSPACASRVRKMSCSCPNVRSPVTSDVSAKASTTRMDVSGTLRRLDVCPWGRSEQHIDNLLPYRVLG